MSEFERCDCSRQGSIGQNNNCLTAATLTFHMANNYGAVLQAFALQKTIANLGVETQILDYRCPAIQEQFHAKPKTLRGWIGQLFRSPWIGHLKNNFECFREDHLRLTDTVTHESISRIADVYDVVIVGSDQVWNPDITNNDLTFFLDFVQNSNKKKAYAASMGVISWDEDCLPECKELVRDFSSVTVREKTASSYLRECIGIEAPVVCDPVFLLNRLQWEDMAVAPRHDPYLLMCFFTRPSKHDLKRIKNIAQNLGLDVVAIHDFPMLLPGVNNVRTAGPLEFLGWIRNASFVVTHSFHAICFSILFEREFIWFKGENETKGISSRASRIEDLFDLLDLTDRKAVEGSAIPGAIDYSRVNRLLDCYRSHSLGQLEELLQ